MSLKIGICLLTLTFSTSRRTKISWTNSWKSQARSPTKYDFHVENELEHRIWRLGRILAADMYLEPSKPQLSYGPCNESP